MGNIFPKSFNRLPIQVLAGLLTVGSTVVFGVTYYFSPEYTRVGYMPEQPVSFSHAIHVEQLGLDCRFCHYGVEKSSHSNVPNTQTCFGCHQAVLAQDPRLEPVRKSWETGDPIPWVRIHQAPDYVYFNHAVHVARGVSCVSCHGQINEMQKVYHAKPLSMGWCLECHREPEKYLRPLEEIYNMKYRPPEGKSQREVGQELVQHWNVNPPQTCQGCHR